MANKGKRIAKKDVENGTNKNEKTIKLWLIIVIIIFLVIIYKIFDALVLTNEKIDISGENYYQYFYGVRTDYSGKIELIQDNDDVQFKLENGEIIHLDNTPIYYKDSLGKVLFAKEMELVIPDIGNYKLRDFTNVIQENKTTYLKKINRKNKKVVNNGFIFDGNDLYFFLEKTTVKIGDMKYELSPLSYVIVNYRESVEIFDYEKEEYIIINDEKQLQSDVLAINNFRNYTVNLSVDSIVTEKSQQLLFGNINRLLEFDY